MKPKVHFQWLFNQTYAEIWDLQGRLQQDIIGHKRARMTSEMSLDSQKSNVHQLLFCEHSPVYTLGKSGKREHLLYQDDELLNNNVEFFRINRGGDITYHGPGQITGYPIFDLEEFFTDIHKYVRLLEESVIIWMRGYGLEGIRLPGYTGVWLAPNEDYADYRKICAIGVHVSRWVTMHGFALNINTDLRDFDRIIPCGISDQDKGVTSLEKETGRKHNIVESGQKLLEVMSELFGFEVVS